METLLHQESPTVILFRSQLEKMRSDLATFVTERKKVSLPPHSEFSMKDLEYQLAAATQTLAARQLTDYEADAHRSLYLDLGMSNGFDFGKYFAEEARV